VTLWRRPGLRRLAAISATFAAALLWTGSAGAGTVSLAPSANSQWWELTYEAAPGETNLLQVVMIVNNEGHPTGKWIVSESSVPLTVGSGCTTLDAHTATCSDPAMPPDEENFKTVVDLGDMDDAVHAQEACGYFVHESCEATIDGGEGNDRLYGPEAGEILLLGGPGDDRLFGGQRFSDYSWDTTRFDGGPGADYMRGNSARPHDTVSYKDRVNDVRVTLHGQADDGEAGEHDTVIGITHIATGAGDDYVVGNSLANKISTLGGRDTVIGGGGHDLLWGGTGRDVLRGSYGNDQLRTLDGYRDDVRGGPGRDLARVDRNLDTRSSIEGALTYSAPAP
jgi:serralysin